jgi:hypothetical protein
MTKIRRGFFLLPAPGLEPGSAAMLIRAMNTCSVGDPDLEPDPDPHVFGPPGSGSISQRYFFCILKINEESSRIRIHFSQRYGSGDPDPHQKVTDPQQVKWMNWLVGKLNIALAEWLCCVFYYCCCCYYSVCTVQRSLLSCQVSRGLLAPHSWPAAYRSGPSWKQAIHHEI